MQINLKRTIQQYLTEDVIKSFLYL